MIPSSFAHCLGEEKSSGHPFLGPRVQVPAKENRVAGQECNELSSLPLRKGHFHFILLLPIEGSRYDSSQGPLGNEAVWLRDGRSSGCLKKMLEQDAAPEADPMYILL